MIIYLSLTTETISIGIAVGAYGITISGANLYIISNACLEYSSESCLLRTSIRVCEVIELLSIL